MVKIKISDLLGKYKMSQKEIAELTGIRPATISAYYHETIIEIKVAHLDSFCKAFNCSIPDLLEYIPDEQN